MMSCFKSLFFIAALVATSESYAGQVSSFLGNKDSKPKKLLSKPIGVAKILANKKLDDERKYELISKAYSGAKPYMVECALEKCDKKNFKHETFVDVLKQLCINEREECALRLASVDLPRDLFILILSQLNTFEIARFLTTSEDACNRLEGELPELRKYPQLLHVYDGFFYKGFWDGVIELNDSGKKLLLKNYLIFKDLNSDEYNSLHKTVHVKFMNWLAKLKNRDLAVDFLIKYKLLRPEMEIFTIANDSSPATTLLNESAIIHIGTYPTKDNRLYILSETNKYNKTTASKLTISKTISNKYNGYLSNLDSLREIALRGHYFSHALKQLSFINNLTKLTKLEITDFSSGDKIVTDLIYKNPFLQYVEIDNINLNNSHLNIATVLNNLSNIMFISLSQNQLTEQQKLEILQTLGKHKTLMVLKMKDPKSGNLYNGFKEEFDASRLLLLKLESLHSFRKNSLLF